MTARLVLMIPALPVVDMPAATTFYAAKLGFRARHTQPGFAIVCRDGVELHLWAASDDSWRTRGAGLPPIISGAETFLAGTASCRIEVTDLDALFREYQQAGVLYAPDTVVTAQPWGQRDFPTLDLHGNLLTFFERVLSPD